MIKKNYSFPWENILVFFLFVAGFFIGTSLFSTDCTFLCEMSASSLMDVKSENHTNKYGIKTVSRVLSLVREVETVSKANTPSDTNYTPNVPVLARENSENIKIKNDTDYEINIDEIINDEVNIGDGNIKVLILHTHTSEAYMMEGEDVYEESDPYRTQNSEKNIVAIGDEIENILKERGIGVIHDRTYHDYPSYTGSYKRALTTAEKILSENQEITLILDIHRDALLSESGNYMKTLAEIEGENCAQALIVIGTDGSGLEHKNWRENLKFGLKLHKTIHDKYPSLVRPLHLCNERYNGHMGKGAMILEIGSNANTLSEAKRCAVLLGECIADFIQNNKNESKS